MGLFSVDYQNNPGQCVYAQGGLKFRADEDALADISCQSYLTCLLMILSVKRSFGFCFRLRLPSGLSLFFYTTTVLYWPSWLHYCSLHSWG